jgi:hypothetical protein
MEPIKWNQYNGTNTMEPIDGTNTMEPIDGTNTMEPIQWNQ